MSVQNFLKAWHASPYDFEKFGPMRDVSGKGQGAASYGRGAAYVAENPKVSGPGESEYMKEFSHHVSIPRIESLAGVPLDNLVGTRGWRSRPPFNELPREARDRLSSLLEDYQSSKDMHGSFKDHVEYHVEMMDEQPDEYDDHEHETVGRVVNFIDRHYAKDHTQGPFSYEVEVHLQPETMLDWDEALVDHHPEAHQKIKSVLDQAHGGEVMHATPPKGSQVYQSIERKLGSDFDASEALFNAGIHGIRYKDGGSRDLKPVLHINETPINDFHDRDLLQAGLSIKSLVYGRGPTLPGDIEAAIDEHVQYMKKEYEEGSVKKSAYDFWLDVQNKVEKGLIKAEVKTPRPTYNYVIFHPDFVRAVAQYDIKGEKVKDLGPGVHLKAVDHNPFEGEK